MNPTTTPEKPNGAWPWRPFLSAYRNEEISVLTFETKQESYKAIDFMWEKLYGMPHSFPGYNSVVVPAEAVHYFAEAGLKFEESKLLTGRPKSLKNIATGADRYAAGDRRGRRF